MRKIINAEGQEFVPVSTDDLVLDAVPTVNSFNSVTSDAVARAVAGASGEVPAVTENDNGKVLSAIYDAGGPAVEWAEAPSSTVSTSGVISGDGSAADPVVLNVGAGLSSVTSGGPTTFTVTDIVEGSFRLTRDQALAILQSQSPVTVNFTGNGSWKCHGAGDEYIFGLNCSGNRTVFFNPLRQWNDATYPQPWEGDISAVNYVLDPSNVDTTHGISVQAMVTALEADPTIEYVYLNYCTPQYGYWTTFSDSLSGYSAVFTVPSASGATTSLVVANPVPAYAAGDAGKVLTVNSGATGVEWAAVPQELPVIGSAGQVLTVNATATGVEWATPSGGGGSSNIVIINYDSTDASSMFSAADTAIQAGKLPVLIVPKNMWETAAFYYTSHGGDSMQGGIMFACTEYGDNFSLMHTTSSTRTIQLLNTGGTVTAYYTEFLGTTTGTSWSPYVP